MKYETVLNEIKCAWCGKTFIVAPEHSWVHRSGNKILKYFCKYTCMLRYREDLKQKRKYRKKGLE